jgi:hypothetical protein
MRGVGFVLTFVAVVGAMVLFRSPSLHAAHSIYVGMAGGHGLALPSSLLAHAGPLTGLLHRLGVGPDPLWDLSTLARVLTWTTVLLGIALLAPNTLEILAPYEPALGWGPERTGALIGRLRLAWRPSLVWALSIAALAAVAVAQLGGPSEFLYWQF